jgi:hypothetical protein
MTAKPKSPSRSKPAPPCTSRPTSRFVVCVDNEGYAASLELHKIYRTLPDAQAAAHRLARVVDESGEDYLYPRAHFVAIRPPQAVQRAFVAVQGL